MSKNDWEQTLIKHLSCTEGNEQTLIDSCTEGNEQKVRELLQKGVNPNCLEEYGYSPLYCCAYKGHTSLIKLLIDCGAKINYANGPTKWTALYGSVFSRQKASVEILLKLGANPNIPNDKGETPLQFAKKQKLDDFVELLSNYTSIKNTPITIEKTTISSPSINSSSNNNSNLNTLNSSSFEQHEDNIWNIIQEGIKLSENLNDKMDSLSIQENQNKKRIQDEEWLLSPLVFESDSLQVVSYRYPDHFTHKFGGLDHTARILTIHFVLESTLSTEHLVSKLQGKFNIGNEFKLVENQVPTRKITIRYQVSNNLDLSTLKTSITNIQSKIGNDIKPLRYLMLIFSKYKKVENIEDLTNIDL